jgi:hypothetical protein
VRQPDELLYSRGWQSVTRSTFRTRKAVIAIQDLAKLEVRRPLLAGAVMLFILSCGLALRFIDILHVHEVAWLVGTMTALVAAASQLGVLRLSSLSLKNETVIGWYPHLTEAAHWIGIAMQSQQHPARRHVAVSLNSEAGE